MKDNTFLHLFSVMAFFLVISSSCTDDAIDENNSVKKPTSSQLAEMKDYFETTAPTLRQVSFYAPQGDRTARQSPSPQEIVNLSPNWDKAHV